MEAIDIINLLKLIVGILFGLCYFHQIVYIIITLFKKPREWADAPQDKRYAILISARNEEAVIPHLLDSIRAQDYPSELIDVYVCADNCTDSTAEVCREKGAVVYERHDLSKIGKGYALAFMLGNIYETHGEDRYDAYFVIDADNLLEKNYVSEMNKCFSAGNRVVTCYRNSKNFGDNWVTTGCGLWFMHVARHLNNARCMLGNTCAVTGTGFMVHKDILKEQGGWKHFLLTEDIEFTVDNTIKGEKISYCHSAIVYDEQPVKFWQSWRQRLRWAKGYLQILHRYGGRLIKGAITKRSFSCYDMLMNVAPAYILTLIAFILNVLSFVLTVIASPTDILKPVIGLGIACLGGFFMFFMMGLATVITEWDRIRTGAGRKIWSLFTFPLFMLTYVPIAIVSLFCLKLEWKPIEHKVAKTMDEMEEEAVMK